MRKKSAHTVGLGEQSGVALFSRWNDFCGLRELVLKKGDTDSIHDLRVASRRMRAAIGLFAPYLAPRAVKSSSKEFRRVTRALGRLRNIDEALIYAGSLSVPLPALAGQLSAAREEEIKVVVDVVKRFPRSRMDRMLREAVADLMEDRKVDQALPVYLSETSIQRYQAVFELLLPATIPENVETRHALRIAIKKWRYLLEILGQVCQKDYAAMLDTLKEYQTLLGRLNDMVEFAGLCAALKLPRHEIEEISAALDRDSASYLAQFIATVASKPLQYTFIL
ncbi:MAG: CHAD domain-containing protein [Desulfobacteraceae bacterium]|nr:CHAD domain-containing protein [Desulfobacteraceae bacterium]